MRFCGVSFFSLYFARLSVLIQKGHLLWNIVLLSHLCEYHKAQFAQSYVLIYQCSEIGFHLQFTTSNATSYIDQGVRLEYKEDSDWEPLRYYTTSLLQANNSAVRLNDDNVSVTARSIYYEGKLPLHVVQGTESLYYREYIINSFPSNRVRVRWSQYFLSIAPDLDVASWLIDNITVIQWGGLWHMQE